MAATSGAAYKARRGRRSLMSVPIRLLSLLFLFGGLILLRAGEPYSTPSVVTRFLYDADGQRVGKQTIHWDSDEQSWRTNLTRFLIDTHHPSGYAQRLAEAGDAGSDASGGGGDRGYLYGLHPIAEVGLERVSYALVDGHHSVRGQLGPGGDFAGQQDYEAFGCALAGNGRSVGEVDREAAGYVGEFTDPSSGLQDLRARQYEPGVGRFRTMDSYEGQREVPAGLHKYLYCHDDPVNMVDPSGHEGVISVVSSMAMRTVGWTMGATRAASAFRTAVSVLTVAETIRHPEIVMSLGPLGVAEAAAVDLAALGRLVTKTASATVSKAGRVIALDTDALAKIQYVKNLLKPGDKLIVTPNVLNEAANTPSLKNMNVEKIISEYNIQKVSSTVGTSVPASRLRQVLDTYSKHQGNAGDGLNISEAAGAGADLFITGDKAVEALFGTSAGGAFNIPFGGGASIGIERVIQP